MIKTPENRMATPAVRTEHAALTRTPLPMAAEVVDVPSPPQVGIRCPKCGRGMVPRRVATTPMDPRVYAACTLCAARLVLTYRADGVPATVRITAR
ncbi:hypothetical protein [Methylibium sp.]|uniref:hypothetical protein n=1 Tax=Methylibium sp. TaxID=2067992 RepID=UPI00182DF309|nr:hypothetical protein [Methylibium sp.]MBA3589961.1 hypothetical protein [Methylibium sp.]